MIVQKTIVCTQTSPSLTAALITTVQEQNGRLIWATNLDEWLNALDIYFPHLGILDIDPFPAQQSATNRLANKTIQTSWELSIKRAKLRPHTKYIPLLVASQRNTDALSKARQSGADETWLHTPLRDYLAELIPPYLDPPIQYVDGWEEALPPAAVKGINYFNQGMFFEQHELLEEAWRADERPVRNLYQGILQIGVAFYQIQLGNWRGAIKTFRRGLPKLRPLPPTCQGVDLVAFLTVAEQIHAEITQLGPLQIDQFDQNQFPKILLTTAHK